MAVAYYYSSTAGEYALTGAINSSATAVTLDSVTGLPTVPFKVVLDPGQSQEEIVKVTNVAGTTLTVVRGWDGSTAVAHAALAKARHMISAEDLRLSREHEDATAVHGATGAIVGTTNAQTLTNKDLSSGTNTFPSSLATDTEVNTVATNLFNHAASAVAHGTTGSVVGTTDTQTLSNKTLASPTLTGTTTAATINASGEVTGSNIKKLHHGTVTIPISASVTADSAVSLSGLGFTNPRVTVTLVAETGSGVSWVFPKVHSVSSSGFTIRVIQVQNTPVTGSVTVHYMVMEG